MEYKLKNITISVVIPTYGEGRDILPALMAADEACRLYQLSNPQESLEIIISDGHPDQLTNTYLKEVVSTGQIELKTNYKLIRSLPGRGNGLSIGAGNASGTILVFWHADTVLPPYSLLEIIEVLNNRTYQAGAFDLKIDSKNIALKIISTVASIRSRITRIPYGDQTIFVSKELYHEVGGFAALPILEDVEFMEKIKQRQIPIKILKTKSTTSPRRWLKEGIIRRTLLNWKTIISYYAGRNIETLAKNYQSNYRK
jgi:rSAM/selenodomain-associated transferase 2